MESFEYTKLPPEYGCAGDEYNSGHGDFALTKNLQDSKKTPYRRAKKLIKLFTACAVTGVVVYNAGGMEPVYAGPEQVPVPLPPSVAETVTPTMPPEPTSAPTEPPVEETPNPYEEYIGAWGYIGSRFDNIRDGEISTQTTETAGHPYIVTVTVDDSGSDAPVMTVTYSSKDSPDSGSEDELIMDENGVFSRTTVVEFDTGNTIVDYLEVYIEDGLLVNKQYSDPMEMLINGKTVLEQYVTYSYYEPIE